MPEPPTFEPEHPELDPERLTRHVRRNRISWNTYSDEYQADHGSHLTSSGGLAWGVWRIPEEELHVLGEIEGRDILELGCGAAQWSIALAERGARPVGVDVSERQLGHARRLMSEAGVDFPLVHASAEAVPLPGGAFDIVFCDWGATTFADPEATVAEAARLLRPGGLFAFSGSTPIRVVCLPLGAEYPGEQLQRDYFGMRKLVDDPEWVEFMLPYGEWIRLFRRNGFIIEDLVELQPAAEEVSSYWDASARAWARRWPAEQIWKLRLE